MPIYHPIKLIQVHIPKTGGTFIVTQLCNKYLTDIRKWYKWPQVCMDLLFGPIHIPVNKTLCLDSEYKVQNTKYMELQHLTYNEIKTFVSPHVFKNYSTFSCVRNPYARCYSDYKWHNKSYSFKDWVEHLVANNSAEVHPIHAKPQYTYVCDEKNNILVDRLIKVEEYSAHSDFFDKYSLSGFKYEKNTDDYKTYYSANMIKQINKLYAKDFEIFGYEKW